MKYLLIVSVLLIGGVTLAEQGVRPEPTGCVNGDSIPLDSDKCENTIHKVDTPEPITEVKTLPSVGAH